MSIERTTGKEKWCLGNKKKKVLEDQVVRFSRKRELLFVIVTAT